MMEYEKQMVAGKNSGFSGSHLKWIALVTMLIDHIGATVLWRLYLASDHLTAAMQQSDFIGHKLIVWTADYQMLVEMIYECCRIIGRVAFPIYCFLLVEGFLHTRSVAKYAGRLFLFALLSEIPFDLALSGEYDAQQSNVFFTLFAGLLLIWCMSYVEKFYRIWMQKNGDKFIGTVLCGAAALVLAMTFCCGAEWISADYGVSGVLAILVIYLFRNSKELGYVLSIVLLTILSSSTEIAALAGLPAVMRYDGTRGRNMKYIFYVFYPLHLLLLGLICVGLGI